ncbi:MAG: DUF3795 domain-containing protein [Anaerolineae bacterium]|nr:DUF3795 domain-containing protein [Anaerolineae bacterium]
MSKMIAYCGLVCTDCPAYLATQANDQAALEAVAAQWREQFHSPEITAATIVCDGCLATSGRLAGYCGMCQIRACGVERGVVNCAHCADYEGCEKLAGFLAQAPEAKTVLDGIRSRLVV